MSSSLISVTIYNYLFIHIFSFSLLIPTVSTSKEYYHIMVYNIPYMVHYPKILIPNFFKRFWIETKNEMRYYELKDIQNSK